MTAGRGQHVVAQTTELLKAKKNIVFGMDMPDNEYRQKDGTLSLRGPGTMLPSPHLVAGRKITSWILASDSEALTIINEITLKLKKDLMNTLTIRKTERKKYESFF